MSTQERIQLSDIPGLGPVRLRALAEVGVRDLQGLLALKVRELAEIRGIGLWQARKIREFLRQRRLLVEDSDNGSMHLVAPQTVAQEEALERSVQAMEAQAEAEARVEAEVQALAEAVAEAQRRSEQEAPEGVSRPSVSADGGRGSRRSTSRSASQLARAAEKPLPEVDYGSPHAEEAVDEAAPAPDWRREIAARREQLPETALGLIEAIRQASVTKQLTRQLTRLLITAGEFVDESRGLTDEARRMAYEALSDAEQMLKRAAQRQAFSADDQVELAKRLRRRRKELEQLLEQE